LEQFDTQPCFKRVNVTDHGGVVHTQNCSGT